MAVTNQELFDIFLANPNMSDAQIVSLMETRGISPEQVSSTFGLPVGDVISRAAATVAPGNTVTLGDTRIAPQYDIQGSGQDQQIGGITNILVEKTTGDVNYKAPVGSEFQNYSPTGEFTGTGVTQKVDNLLGEFLLGSAALFGGAALAGFGPGAATGAAGMGAGSGLTVGGAGGLGGVSGAAGLGGSLGSGLTTAGVGGLGGLTGAAGLGGSLGAGLTTAGGLVGANTLLGGAGLGTTLAGLGGGGTLLGTAGTSLGTVAGMGGAGTTLGTGLTGGSSLSGLTGGSSLSGLTTGAGTLAGTNTLLGGAGLGTTLGGLTTGVLGSTVGSTLGSTVGSTLGSTVANTAATGLGGLTSAQLASLLSTGLTTGSGLLQQQTSREAAQAALQMINAETAAAKQGAQFRPIGMTTRFGTSQFVTDPTTGRLTSAGYTLDPQAKNAQDRLVKLAEQGLVQAEGAQAQFAPLQTGAQRLFELGQGYLAKTPESVAQNYLNQQMALLQPGRETELATLQNRLQQQGRGGLSVAQGGTMGATTPELQALYNARAQQEAQLAANAQQFGQQQVNFGAGLLGQGASAMGQYYGGQQQAYSPFTTALGQVQGLEQLAQQPLQMGINLGQIGAQTGFDAGRLGLQGAGQATTLATGPAATNNPYATLLGGLGASPTFGAAGVNALGRLFG